MDPGIDGSRHSKSMDNTSLNHSDIFILMIGTFLFFRDQQNFILWNTSHKEQENNIYRDKINPRTARYTTYDKV